MKEITGILVDVYNQKIESKTLQYKDYDDYHYQLEQLLKCKWFEYKRISLSDIECYATFDEIGKLRKDRKVIPGLILANNKTAKICDYIAGNIWIEKYEGGDDTTSFNDEDIMIILNVCIDKIKFNNKLTREFFETKVLVSLDDWVDITERFGDSND